VTGQQGPGRLTLVCHNSPAIAVAVVLALLAAGHGTLAVVSAVRVLIVDDQQPFRAAASKVVEMTAGFEVAGEAETEEGSVRMPAELDPDLVLMDVNLAGVSAREATRRILNWSDRVVVFLLSTYEATEYASWAAGCGAAAYITKAELDPTSLARAWEEAAPRRPGPDTSRPA